MHIILIFTSFIAALVSGTAGFGGALILLPVVVTFVGTSTAVPILTLAQLIGNLSRMVSGFNKIDWKSVFYFCVTALPLAALGAFGFSVLNKEIVTRCIGAILVLMVILKMKSIFKLKGNKKTLLIGGGITGVLSGLVGSGGPIGALVFLSLDLSPVAYIATEATTATAMHILKSIIYSKMANVTYSLFLLGIEMGIAMILGTFISNIIIKEMDKCKFQKYVAILLCVVGIYMVIFGN